MRHVSECDQASEERDQREFDEAVKRDTPYALSGVAIFAAVVAIAISAVGLARSGSSNQMLAATPAAVTQMSSPQMAAMTKAKTATASATSAVAAPVVSLRVIPEYKLGPDGKKHDAFTKTEFNLKVGQPLRLRIDNTDSADHTITAPAAAVNISVKPGVHTYTLLVQTAGRFQWYCMLPCDEWAMQHVGYMSGYITAS
jgi:plastocyanin